MVYYVLYSCDCMCTYLHILILTKPPPPPTPYDAWPEVILMQSRLQLSWLHQEKVSISSTLEVSPEVISSQSFPLCPPLLPRILGEDSFHHFLSPRKAIMAVPLSRWGLAAAIGCYWRVSVCLEGQEGRVGHWQYNGHRWRRARLSPRHCDTALLETITSGLHTWGDLYTQRSRDQPLTDRGQNLDGADYSLYTALPIMRLAQTFKAITAITYTC